MTDVVIVGAGQAGYQCAESLRQEGYQGEIILIGDEAYPPYQRPPLSKSYLLGEVDKARLQFRTREYFDEHGIKLLTGTTVNKIDPAHHRVVLDDGTEIRYTKLVLATGARVRALPVPGAKADGVCYLKTIDDIDRIEQLLPDSSRVVVIGAGFIGLEFAAVANKLGKQVQVIESMDRVMGRVVHPILSEYYHKLHSSHGVQFVYNTTVSGIEVSDGRVKGVSCSNGSHYPADLVVVGIGVIANTELAEEAGIECDHGIVVDAYGRTSVVDVYATGDCTIYHHPFAQDRIRLESVQNAVDQSKSIAASLSGKDKPYDVVPWFWSDQYDSKLQMVGLSSGCDEHVVRGDITTGKFSIFHFRDGVLRAIDSVNKPADHMMGRKLLAAGVSPDMAQASDPDFPLKSLLV